MKNIGVDIGGTFIKCAIVDKDGKIVLSSKTPTPKDGRDIPKAICDIIAVLTVKADVAMEEINSVGIGTTGVCDSKRGVVMYCPNIEGYNGVAVCDYVREKLGKDTFLDNDANCAALGEYMLTEDKPKSFVFVTLGTGVGGGIILSGQILRGINGGAGEIGHIVIRSDGERCSCGRIGCWERYASVSALVRQTKAKGFEGNITGKTAFEEAARGNRAAIEVIDTWLNHVSAGICDIVNIFQPERVVIGGGISREGDKILNPVKEAVRKNTMTGSLGELRQTEISISKLFNDAGVVGASFLYTQK